jgi:hypothetical protein
MIRHRHVHPDARITRSGVGEGSESEEGGGTIVVSTRAVSRLERIIERVRAISASRGRGGAPLEDWLRAEREIDAEIESLETSTQRGG